jgi:hypothetical protein
LKLKILQLVVICLLALGCAGCKWNKYFLNPWQQRADSVPPVLFSSVPPKEELIAALSVNSQRIKTLQSHGATVSVAGLPSVSTDIALERPAKFRFKASASFLGPLVDMGSNDEILWFWTSQTTPANVYFARHDRLAASPIRQRLAIDPGMFVEALGFVELSPEQVVGEPVTAGKDRIQLVCRQVMAGGEYRRTFWIHSRYGYLVEQQITSPTGQTLVSTKLSEQRHYALDGVTLPHKIDLHVPDAELRLQLNVPNYFINQPFTTGENTFAFPREQLASYPLVDIADPNFVPPGAGPPAQYSSPGTPPPAHPGAGFAPPGFPNGSYPAAGYGAPNQPPPSSAAVPTTRYRGGLY